MLPKKHRLTKREVIRVFKHRTRVIRTPLFVVYFQNSLDTPLFKAAVTISKKVAAHAVDRNKIRRKIYDALRPFCPQSGHVVIVVQKSAIAASDGEITMGISETMQSLV